MNSSSRNDTERRYSNLKPNAAPDTGKLHSFTDDADFVAFVLSDDEQRPVREWDKGKRAVGFEEGDNREEASAGRKRRWEESERSEESMSFRRGVNVNVPSRKAPWTANVDWDEYKNVAEMYVLANGIRALPNKFNLNGIFQAAPRSRSVY